MQLIEVAINMFNTKIPLYGIFIIISILSGLWVVYKNAKQLNLRTEEITGLLLYIGIFYFFNGYQKIQWNI